MTNWITTDQLLGTAFSQAPKKSVSALPLGDLCSNGFPEDCSPLFYTGRAHAICVAPSGSGKSQALAIPALLEWPHSAIVLDVKGELFYHTAGYREAELGQRIIRFDPSDPESESFNPLACISQDEMEIEQQVKDIVRVIVKIPREAREPFFLRAARNVIEVAIYATLAKGAYNPPAFNEVVRLCYDVEGFYKINAEIADKVAGGAIPDSARNLAKSIQAQFFYKGDDGEPKLNRTGQSVWAEVTNQLSPLNTAQIKAATKKASWTPDVFRKEPTTLYLCLPPTARGSYGLIMALLLNAHIAALMDGRPDVNAPPILLLLDEMPQLGKMSAIEQVVDLGRAYGLLLYAFCQRRAQLKKHYGEPGDFLGTFELRMYMNPTHEDGSAEELSKAIGKKQSPNTTGQFSEQDAAPISQLAGAEYAQDIIALSRGANPARIRKVMTYQNEAYEEAIELRAENAEKYAPI